VTSQVYWELVRYQGLVSKASDVLFAEGMKTSDHFRGIAFSGGIHSDRFLDVLANSGRDDGGHGQAREAGARGKEFCFRG
jgi:hypothetical protein